MMHVTLNYFGQNTTNLQYYLQNIKIKFDIILTFNESCRVFDSFRVFPYMVSPH